MLHFTRHLTILFVLATFLILSTLPATAQEPTTTDAATVEFWQACSTLGGTAPDDDVPGYISYFDWYSIENPDNLNVVPFCVTAYVGPEKPDETAQPILQLYIRFYRGTPGHIDPGYILSQIHAHQQ